MFVDGLEIYLHDACLGQYSGTGKNRMRSSPHKVGALLPACSIRLEETDKSAKCLSRPNGSPLVRFGLGAMLETGMIAITHRWRTSRRFWVLQAASLVPVAGRPLAFPRRRRENFERVMGVPIEQRNLPLDFAS